MQVKLAKVTQVRKQFLCNRCTPHQLTAVFTHGLAWRNYSSPCRVSGWTRTRTSPQCEGSCSCGRYAGFARMGTWCKVCVCCAHGKGIPLTQFFAQASPMKISILIWWVYKYDNPTKKSFRVLRWLRNTVVSESAVNKVPYSACNSAHIMHSTLMRKDCDIA